MISGKYVYNFPFSVVEGSNSGDELVLNENGTFKSDTWGNGTYTLTFSKLSLNNHGTFTLYRRFF